MTERPKTDTGGGRQYTRRLVSRSCSVGDPKPAVNEPTGSRRRETKHFRPSDDSGSSPPSGSVVSRHVFALSNCYAYVYAFHARVLSFRGLRREYRRWSNFPRTLRNSDIVSTRNDSTTNELVWKRLQARGRRPKDSRRPR